MMNAFDARSLTSNNNKINIYTNNRYFKITNDFSTVACWIVTNYELFE